jgi:hypothetical protein
MIKNCVVCGKEFLILKRQQRKKSCSPECVEKRIKDIQLKIRSTPESRLYKREYMELYRSIKTEKEIEESKKSCAICGSLFIKKAALKYCSHDCKKLALNKQNRNRSPEAKERAKLRTKTWRLKRKNSLILY